MSSYICTPKHFNSIEQKIADLINYNSDFYFPYKLRREYPVLYSRTSLPSAKEEEISKIIDCLRELNAVCVTLQYKDHYKGKLDKEISDQKQILFEGKKEGYKNLTLTGLYNALRCLNYQIESEHLKDLFGLNTEQENALLFIETMTNELAHMIIRELPEDKSNRWSID